MGVTTLPETNIAPENGPSQKEIHIPTIHFQGRTVSFREGNYLLTGMILQVGALQNCFRHLSSERPAAWRRPMTWKAAAAENVK